MEPMLEGGYVSWPPVLVAENLAVVCPIIHAKYCRWVYSSGSD